MVENLVPVTVVGNEELECVAKIGRTHGNCDLQYYFRGKGNSSWTNRDQTKDNGTCVGYGTFVCPCTQCMVAAVVKFFFRI